VDTADIPPAAPGISTRLDYRPHWIFKGIIGSSLLQNVHWLALAVNGWQSNVTQSATSSRISTPSALAGLAAYKTTRLLTLCFDIMLAAHFIEGYLPGAFAVFSGPQVYNDLQL
jgi:hypothetical protein